MKYRHLEHKDRKRISRLKSYGYSYAKIGRLTGFNKSTISRELKRNGAIINRDMKFYKKMYLDMKLYEEYERIRHEPDYELFLKYECRRADELAKYRRQRAGTSRTRIKRVTVEWIIEKLKIGWTPQQISGRSKSRGPQDVSHEYIYRLIIRDKRNGGKLYRLLKRFGKRKRRISERSYTKEIIPGRIGIENRPSVVKKRKRLGDLEGDLIVGGCQKSYLLTVVDRCSRQVVIEPLMKRDRKSVETAFIKAIHRLPSAKTLTLDNAREFSCHVEISKQLGIKVYFCNPYSSYERGTIENTNGIIRRTFPKKTDFRKIPRKKVAALEKTLNTTPRKILNYLTAEEVVSKHRINHSKFVALRS